ncbi:MAG TPA: 2Fe-2S iron-sulfur cluster-binding protein [Bacteroidia bacterium]|jgi:ring-1,2-phenylacetyl-CoA epoxidase subunit PaaE|nr:2Fe-2S iron-sulfur cluster-binding protein [Bacteroidia bacterium]
MENTSIIKRVKLVQVIVETEDARTFILKPLDGWLATYKPGQFITFIFNTPFGEKRRSFSITSSPALTEPLSITVKKVDNGEFSRPLVYFAKPGDIFYTSGISGMFTLPEQNWPECFCFLAAGSGVTPCYALIKTILATSIKQVVLFYSNRTTADAIFYKQLVQLQEHYPDRFRIHFFFSDHKDLQHRRLSKWLLDQLMDKYVPDKKSALYYLCGPYEYMQTVNIVLLNHVNRNQIRKESFSSLPRTQLPQPPDKLAHAVTIHIGQNTYNVQVQYPDSILKTAKVNHIQLPYSCEAGRCSSCAATCLRGTIWMAYNEVLTDEEVKKGRVLTCQGFPVGGDAEIIF